MRPQFARRSARLRWWPPNLRRTFCETPADPCFVSKLLVFRREPFEKTFRLPRGPRVRIGDAQSQPLEDSVELRCGGVVDRLAQVVLGTVIALLVPIVELPLLGRSGEPAEFEGQRWDTSLNEAVLIATDEPHVIRLLIGFGLGASGPVRHWQ